MKTPKIHRNVYAEMMAARRQKAGSHHTRSLDVVKGRSRKPKHRVRVDDT